MGSGIVAYDDLPDLGRACFVLDGRVFPVDVTGESGGLIKDRADRQDFYRGLSHPPHYPQFGSGTPALFF